MPPFRLAHLSDPHLPPPPGALAARDLVSKRLLSAAAWRRKRREHQFHVLEALAADIRAYDPDHIALTGDLTNFATPAEFEGARAWLQGFGDPSRLTVSPGNHDALVGRGAPARFAPWREWLGDESEPAFPAVRVRGPVAVVNLCSAVPTPPWSAGGRLGREQLERLDAVLGRLRQEGRFRLLMIHHPPAEGVVGRRKSLMDAPALRALVARQGAELILHGHGHEPAFSRLEGPDGPIPVLGAPSASAVGERHAAARWHGLEIEDGRIRVVARGASPRGGGFETLGSYVLDAPQRR